MGGMRDFDLNIYTHLPKFNFVQMKSDGQADAQKMGGWLRKTNYIDPYLTHMDHVCNCTIFEREECDNGMEQSYHFAKDKLTNEQIKRPTD